MKNKTISLIFALLLLAGSVAGWRHYREARLSDMVGQMILVGFRGTSPEDSSVLALADDIRQGKIGGVQYWQDILLFGNNLSYSENIGQQVHEEIMKMVHSGDIPRARIQESYERIVKLKASVR